MQRLVIRSYDESYAEALTRILAAVRRTRRSQAPLLPAGLDEEARAARIIATKGEGALALDAEGRIGGFLFAARKEDGLWGPSVRAELNDWAVGPGVGIEAATGLLSGLYAAVFGPLSRGVREHRIVCPASDSIGLGAWFGLGFGKEQAYAISRLEDLDVRPPADGDFEIRRAASGDSEALVAMSHLIAQAQAGPPVWAGAPEAYLADLREGFAGLAGEAGAIVLLAFRGGRPVGYQAWFPTSEDPFDGSFERGVELGVAATIPEERGRGLGLALTARGIAEARAAGYQTCITDWRTANPHAAPFWLGRGFKPFAYRLTRRLP